MSTDVSGMIECRPGAHLWGPDDEHSVWHAAIDLFLLNDGNAYDALACLFGIRNSFGFRPLAEGRGFPNDASEGLRTEYAAYEDSADVHGTIPGQDRGGRPPSGGRADAARRHGRERGRARRGTGHGPGGRCRTASAASAPAGRRGAGGPPDGRVGGVPHPFRPRSCSPPSAGAGRRRPSRWCARRSCPGSPGSTRRPARWRPPPSWTRPSRPGYAWPPSSPASMRACPGPRRITRRCCPFCRPHRSSPTASTSIATSRSRPSWRPC